VLEQPRILSAFDRDAIHLGFGLWVARMAWQMRVDASTIHEILAGKQPGEEKAAGTPPAEEGDAPTSSAPIIEAPKPLPAISEEDQRPAEERTSLQEPSVSDGSGGMQDGLPVHPATHPPAGKSTKARAFVAPPGEDHERTAKREDVAALNDREPWLTPDEAAARLHMPVVNLRIFSSELDIEWSQPRPIGAPTPTPSPPAEIPRTLMQKVTTMHRLHPTWTATLIADALGAPRNTVSSYLATARKVVREERARAA
jgi:plasmid maintenance system antidote protein VapI